MTIQDRDFILTPIKSCSPMFDLDLLQTVNKGKSNEREEFQNEAYGVTLDYAIRIIANYRIRKKAGDSVITLQDYIIQFRDAIDNLKELCYVEKERE